MHMKIIKNNIMTMMPMVHDANGKVSVLTFPVNLRCTHNY